MEVGTITEWKKKEGEAFGAGDIICLVETDKATVDFEAQEEGYIAKILVQAGTSDIKVGAPIMVTVEDKNNVGKFADFSAGGGGGGGAKAADKSKSVAPSDTPAVPSPPPAAEKTAPEPASPPSPPSKSGGAAKGGRVVASPLAKALAAEKGYDLSELSGTGPGGRIIAADVREHQPSASAAPKHAEREQEAPAVAARQPPPAGAPPKPTGGQGYTDYPVSESARQIAERLAHTKLTVPHYYLTVDLRLDSLLRVREQLNEGLPGDEQISLNDMLLKAAALATRKVPDVNSSWLDTLVRQYHSVDVNLLVGAGDGLVAPVVKDVGSRGLRSLSQQIRGLAKGAQEQSLSAEQCSVGTFSITNLGMYGVKSFAPIVMAPQACMLALGKAEERVIPNEDPKSEEIYQLSTMLTATLSCDHRAVDGAVGAAWLAAYKGLVENPLTMLL